ncbi:ArsR/SmtB family transcription factor [Spongiactinospora sp. 9N601]|uniref:ArsR/SmtB family transcription factor n=1 Tax=Spongiactinospora sp. 9N601 TaxID=3375149 RepID=UPI00378DBC1A
MDAEPFAKDADITKVAGLMADATRAAMLTTLLDGRALAAGELARAAGVSPPTGSAHLGRLLDGGLVTVVSQGRHRYYRLAGPDVAAALEVLARISPRPAVRSLKGARQARLLRDARTCYDHLAGRAGVDLLDRLVAAGCLLDRGGRYDVPQAGEAMFLRLGVDVPEVRRARRKFAPSCLDWTERRPHLGGALGAALTGRLIERGWFERGQVRRALRITDKGRVGLETLL